jgi:predicted ATPase
MAKNGQPKSHSPGPPVDGITRVTVGGFKSLAQEQSIDIRPLTILAGANSSGKSSIMQPLLLLKQTLESSFDPGTLLLDGPNLKFTSSKQLFSLPGLAETGNAFHVGFTVNERVTLSTCYEMKKYGIDILSMSFLKGNRKIEFKQNMSSDEIEKVLQNKRINKIKDLIVKDRCFLNLAYVRQNSITYNDDNVLFTAAWIYYENPLKTKSFNYRFDSHITNIIHVPGLRGNPSRTYPVAAVGAHYPGTFEKYTASVINEWEVLGNTEELDRLSSNLKSLGLSWKVSARRINDTQIELQVGRLPQSGRGARDVVSIADVGLGVSQALPVLVALQAAAPGQLVYLEQPEIHLHPRAQTAMATVLANAAKRGVRVVVETHSDLLILGIQTEVAKGNLPPELVKLHWFQRRKDGTTQITSADLDEAGTSGDWPEDFDDVRLNAQSEFLDASLDFKESR